MTNEEVIAAVSELNQEIWENTGNEYYQFEFLSNGYASAITFLGNRVWFEDEDEREYDEENDTYEPLVKYLRREAKKEIEKIGKLFK